MFHTFIESIESRIHFADTTGSGLPNVGVVGSGLGQPGLVEVINGVLTVKGTTGADELTIVRETELQVGEGIVATTALGPTLRVDFNGNTFSFDTNSVTSIHADMGAGNDRVTIGKNVKLACTLIGARGNDSLEGGTRDDVLSGGAGDDWLFGGHGTGTDLIFGGPSNAQDVYGVTLGDTLVSGAGSIFVVEPPNIAIAPGQVIFINPFGIRLEPGFSIR